MATIYRCDRCHRDTTDKDDMTKLDIEWSRGSYKGQELIKKDLCSNCMGELSDFCKPLAKQMSK